MARTLPCAFSLNLKLTMCKTRMGAVLANGDQYLKPQEVLQLSTSVQVTWLYGRVCYLGEQDQYCIYAQ